MTPPSSNQHEHYVYRFDQLDGKMDKALDGIDYLKTYIFIGNGKPALSNRVEKLEEKETARDILLKQTSAKRWAITLLIISSCLAVLIPKLFILVKFVLTII